LYYTILVYIQNNKDLLNEIFLLNIVEKKLCCINAQQKAKKSEIFVEEFVLCFFMKKLIIEVAFFVSHQRIILPISKDILWLKQNL